MFKKLLFLSPLFSFLIFSQLNALDHQKLDKLMTYYIKNDDDQFKELLDEIVAHSKNQAELYNDLQALSSKFNDFNGFYTKKRDKRLVRGRKSLTNTIFYSVAAALGLAAGGSYCLTEKDPTAQAICGGLSVALASVCAWFARANLTSSILEYNFFPKLLRKNKKFWSAVEKLKQATALQMEVQIPVAEGVKLEID